VAYFRQSGGQDGQTVPGPLVGDAEKSDTWTPGTGRFADTTTPTSAEREIPTC
jgi:hypothetical protein